MILDKIVESTKKRLQINEPFVFEKALKKDDMAFICEVKKASPSKGVISNDFPYIEIAEKYEAAGASAISVLTEPEFFQGANKYLTEIKKAIKIPILRKDFIISEYQIYESRVIGADGILLICAILDTDTLSKYITLADSLGLSCLVEAHNEHEIKSAIDAGARVIGVNNRDLRTFEVDINNSLRLRRLVPNNIIFVSESGISTPNDIEMLRLNGTNAVLIGETLMKSKDIKSDLENLRNEK